MKKLILAAVILLFAVCLAKSQDFIAPPKKMKIAIGAYPISGKVAMKMNVGKFIVEDNFGMKYSMEDDAHMSSNEMRVMYTYNTSPVKRFYSGVGMEFRTTFYEPKVWYSDGYPFIIPLAIEIFPLNHVPRFSFTMEPVCWNFSNVYANFGIFYYL